jgi:predicted DNA-binding protein with PD1-like motif
MNSSLKNNEQSTQAVIHVFRLLPQQDLKRSILEYARANGIKAACVVTCVGSLVQVNLRFANQQTGTLFKGHYEILSLTGTFSDSAAHLHLSVADNNGPTTGGHLLDDNLVYTTAEVVVMELSDLEFVREVDPAYGYHELKIKKITPAQ